MEHVLIGVGTIAGVFGHVLKKLVQERQQNKALHLKQYLTDNPYQTALVVFYAGAAVAGLYMTETQSVYTAIMAGFTANSLSGKSDG